MSEPVSDDCERLLLDAEGFIRQAGQMFADCPLDALLFMVGDVLPRLSQVARAALEVAQDEAGKKFDDKTVTVRGVEWERSRGGPKRTGWRTDDLLHAVLDTRLVDGETGEVKDETPLEKVLHVWNLPAPRSTALSDRGLNGDEFCHVEWPEDRPWKVVPASKKRKAKR